MKSKNPSSFFINYEKIQRPSVAGTVGGGLCDECGQNILIPWSHMAWYLKAASSIGLFFSACKKDPA